MLPGYWHFSVLYITRWLRNYYLDISISWLFLSLNNRSRNPDATIGVSHIRRYRCLIQRPVDVVGVTRLCILEITYSFTVWFIYEQV
ncbi:hypothetical protein ACU8KH_05359 [Lachancea thermotolerans]